MVPKAVNIAADAVYYVPEAAAKIMLILSRWIPIIIRLNTLTVQAVTVADTEALNIPVWRVHQEH